jgi:very-short-patch-repair endonuclease
MRASQSEIATVLSATGLISRQQHPELATALAWMKRSGQLHSILPGVYCDPAAADDAATRIRAVPLWCADAVLTGHAAARVSFWPGISLDDIELAADGRTTKAAGYRITRRLVPPDLVEDRHGLRYTTPALTALDLADTVGGDGIDTALRMRAATLTQMHEAMHLSRSRSGNALRRQLLLDSRNEPWSAGERLLHRLLRRAGLTGWRANVAVPAVGSVYYIDVAFDAEMVAIEVDGRLHENDPGIFESDRWRQNHLVLRGWHVLRFTWSMLTQHPELVVQDVETALRMSRQSGRGRAA